MANFTQSVVEHAALAWLDSLGYAVKHGPEIAPGELFAEREVYGQVILTIRLREALVRLNPTLPPEAIDDAFCKITRLEGSTLDARNRAFPRLLVDGVTVEDRIDSSIRVSEQGDANHFVAAARHILGRRRKPQSIRQSSRSEMYSPMKLLSLHSLRSGRDLNAALEKFCTATRVDGPTALRRCVNNRSKSDCLAIGRAT